MDTVHIGRHPFQYSHNTADLVRCSFLAAVTYKLLVQKMLWHAIDGLLGGKWILYNDLPSVKQIELETMGKSMMRFGSSDAYRILVYM